MDYSSKLIEQAVNEFSRLPGIGKKTALRFVLHLLKQDESEVVNFSAIIKKLKEEVKFCKQCFNISDTELCSICSSSGRNESIICVVQDIRDVIAVEQTGHFHGLYHVLGGIISPMDGIGPSNLNIESLIQRIQTGNVKEVIMALPASMEGETTNFYIYKKLMPQNIQVTIIARGISVGDELEYADEVSLGRSIQLRIPYSNNLLEK